MKIKETCSCGASTEVEDKIKEAILNVIAEWRENHKHVIKTEPYVIPSIPTDPYPYRQPHVPYWEGPTIIC